MAATKGRNTYVSIAEANTYFADRVSADNWNTADDILRGKALVTATSLLEEMRWNGTAISEDQSLAFPRNIEYFDPRLGVYKYINDEIPDRVLKAQMELALHLLDNDGVLNETSQPTSISLGEISITGTARQSKIPSRVRELIRPLLQNGGSQSWWRAN